MISVREGCAYLPVKPKLSKEILRSIYCEGQRKVPLLRKLYEQQDWKNYAIEVHALKSVAATAGQTVLSEMAKAHEMSAKELSVQFIEENFDILIHTYEEYLSGLSYLAEDESATEKTALPDDEVQAYWEQIKRGAEEFDIDCITAAIETLKSAQLSEAAIERLKQVAEAAELLDYETVVSLL